MELGVQRLKFSHMDWIPALNGGITNGSEQAIEADTIQQKVD
jgi:hypothetical protein